MKATPSSKQAKKTTLAWHTDVLENSWPCFGNASNVYMYFHSKSLRHSQLHENRRTEGIVHNLMSLQLITFAIRRMTWRWYIKLIFLKYDWKFILIYRKIPSVLCIICIFIRFPMHFLKYKKCASFALQVTIGNRIRAATLTWVYKGWNKMST